MIRVRTSVSNAFAPETKIVHHRATTAAASEQKESARAGSSVLGLSHAEYLQLQRNKHTETEREKKLRPN